MKKILDAINSLDSRRGPAPRMTPTNPQEQLEQFPTDWGIIEQLTEYAFSLAKVVERPTQIAPPGSRALTFEPMDATHKRDAFMVDLEFAHIHNPPIGSMHLTLPKSIRDIAIAKGWALRHPLAIRNIVSPNVTFVFAPRDLDELVWAKLLLTASHHYALQNHPAGATATIT
jgi:phospholipase/carboxylesterase